MELDKIDLKILNELDQNSRISLKKLSTIAKCSKSKVQYRINRLVSEKIIDSFYTVVNFNKLGYLQYKLYFKYYNVDPSKEIEIINYWQKDKNSTWVGSLRGSWDLGVSILCENEIELAEVITKFMYKYSKFIFAKVVFLTEYSYVFTRYFLEHGKEKKYFRYSLKKEKIELDDTDKKILHYMAINARISIEELSELVKRDRDTVAYRIKKLIKLGIIAGFRININLNKVKYKTYKILLNFKGLNEKNETEIINYIKNHRFGTQYLKLIGSWDSELEFEMEEGDEIYKHVGEFRQRFNQLITQYEIILISNNYKLSYFPF
jgi:Lrp/AsnC family transcriptional regulator, leucine-responsive regulatory protein